MVAIIQTILHMHLHTLNTISFIFISTLNNDKLQTLIQIQLNQFNVAIQLTISSLYGTGTMRHLNELIITHQRCSYLRGLMWVDKLSTAIPPLRHKQTHIPLSSLLLS